MRNRPTDGRRRRRHPSAGRLGGVRIGINLIVLYLLGVLAAFVFVIASAREWDLQRNVTRAAGLGLYSLGFVGKAFGLATPRETGCRDFIVISVVVEILAFGLSVAGGALSMPLLQLISVALALWGWSSFLAFLGELGRYLGRSDLGETADACAKLAFAEMTVGLLVWAATHLLQVESLAILFLVPLMLALMFVGRFSVLLLSLREEL